MYSSSTFLVSLSKSSSSYLSQICLNCFRAVVRYCVQESSLQMEKMPWTSAVARSQMNFLKHALSHRVLPRQRWLDSWLLYQLCYGCNHYFFSYLVQDRFCQSDYSLKRMFSCRLDSVCLEVASIYGTMAFLLTCHWNEMFWKAKFPKWNVEKLNTIRNWKR